MQQLLTSNQAWHYRIIPEKIEEQKLFFYCEEGADLEKLANELEVLFGKEIKLTEVNGDEIHVHLARFYRKAQSDSRRQQIAVNGNPDSYLENIIAEAKEIKSSDIHIEPFEEYARVRLRIDGKLIERYRLNIQEYPSLINRIKILANLDIAEKRLPQDGRILFKTHNHHFDIRVSTLPSLHGEKAVLRLLSKDTGAIDINKLGFSELQLKHYQEEIKKHQGIIIISGPTGSGKTTTLYATLKILNKEEFNILTIEDPIEYTLEGINQVQLKENIGLSFASALRTFLRQDPDIIMLGEIRDGETAQMAIRAALTGHLVLTTIHTNSAWGTISRLADMGIPPFLISGTLNMSIAQRLVRLLCPKCKTPKPFDSGLLPEGFKAKCIPEKMYEKCGCSECFYTGYSGRIAIYEVIPIDEELRTKIKNNEQQVEDLLQSKNIPSLSQQAYYLFTEGKTSLTEIYPILLSNSI